MIFVMQTSVQQKTDWEQINGMYLTIMQVSNSKIFKTANKSKFLLKI